jgi:phosphoglycerol transferase MdoB-like AlkP superfamily enzyme
LLGLSGLFFALRSPSTSFQKATIGRWILLALLFILTGQFLVKEDPFVGSFLRNAIIESSWARSLRFHRIAPEKLKEGFAQTGIPLSFKTPPSSPSTFPKKNLVLVILESMPNKYLSLFSQADETQPLLSQYASRMVRYPNFFCNWPSSNHARLTIWSGLYPMQEFLSAANPMISTPALPEVLASAGYENAIFYSSDRNYTRMADYIGHRGISIFEDAKTMEIGLSESNKVSWGVREEVTLEQMQSFLKKHATNSTPFSLTYIPASPHMPFDIDEPEFDRFSEGFGDLDGNYTGVYKNELLYMDWILHNLIQSIEKEGLLENTVVVLVSDHAEGVNTKKEGGLGHGWSSAPDMANISLMIWPTEKSEQGTINTNIGSEVDLYPTILDYLGLPAPTQVPLQGCSLRTDTHTSRRIYLGSYRDCSVIDGTRFFWFPDGELDRASCFQISNHLAQTFFVPDEKVDLDTKRQMLEAEKKFRILQTSLLQNYETYNTLLTPATKQREQHTR